MRLKTAEAIAIRWHMGGFDDAVRGGSFAVSDAYNSYPLAVKLHIADLTGNLPDGAGHQRCGKRAPQKQMISYRT